MCLMCIWFIVNILKILTSNLCHESIFLILSTTSRSWIKGAVVLVVLLGLTWFFGLMYMSNATTVMAYIFTILNTLQGLFIYIFHCVMNDKVASPSHFLLPIHFMIVPSVRFG